MTPEEVLSESIQRTRELDDDAALAAEAFAFGLGDKYIAHRQADISRRLSERYGDTDTAGGVTGAGG